MQPMSVQKYKLLGNRIMLEAIIPGKLDAKTQVFTPTKKGNNYRARVIQIGSKVVGSEVAVGDLVEVDKSPRVVEILEQTMKNKKGLTGVIHELWVVKPDDITAIVNPDYKEEETTKDEIAG